LRASNQLLAAFVFAYSFAMVYLGRLFNLPDWTTRITPFGQVPQIPVQSFAAALCAAGLWRFARRDTYQKNVEHSSNLSTFRVISLPD